MRKRRGVALLMVFALMFVLLTLVAGLHYRQSSARANLYHEEATLQARVAAEYELAKQCCPTGQFNPATQAVQGVNQHTAELDVEVLQANKLFKTGALTDVGMLRKARLEKTIQARAGVSWNMVKARSLDPSLQPSRSQFLAVVSNDFPYAACAPHGKITGGEIIAWRNPLFTENVTTEKAYSGGIARLAAGGDVTLGKCAYGEIYCNNGSVSVDEGQFVAYAGQPGDLQGPTAYPNTIRDQVDTIKSLLGSQAQDKTDLMNGSPFSVETILDLFRGKVSETLARALSLRQAMHFPFLMIPGLRIKGIIVMIWLHMPYPPDIKAPPPDSPTKQKVDAKQAEVEAKGKAIDDLKKQRDAEKDAQKKAKIEQQISDEEKSSEQLGKDLQTLSTDLSKEMGIDKEEEDPQDPELEGPLNRDAEAGMDDKLGQFGWSYKPFYKKIFDFCKNVVLAIFQGQKPEEFLAEAAKSLYQNVRLVHFGGKSYDTDFTIDDTTAEMAATFNVPPGRGLKLRTNVKIKGDLWLMRGSSLVVDGNLDLLNPQSSTSLDPRKPRGRLFMEEGSTLVVTGNFNCAGSPALGSVLVGGPINQLHPGLSSIMVGGDVTMPFGVWPAFSIGDIDMKEVPELGTFRDVVATVVPNLAKLAGPFHRRKPYFSQFATNFLCACVLTPIGPMPIPIPAPLPEPENVNNKIFRAMSMIYSIQMNLAWGENFITHTDWWFLGQGMVPMFPKVNPIEYVDKLKNLHMPKLPDASKIQDMLKDQAPKLVEKMVPPLLAEVIVKLVIDQLTMGFGGQVVSALPIEEWLKEVIGVESVQDALTEIPGLTDLAESIKGKVGDAAALIMLHETPAVLIYAGGNLNVANDATFPVPLTIGMLVAGKDIHSNASYTVGSALSLNGDIKVKNLLFDPNATRCSIYVPNNAHTKITTMDWLDWALEYRYGSLFENQAAKDVGPALRHATMEGWTQ